MTTDHNCPISIGDLVRACCEMGATDSVSIVGIAAALGIHVTLDTMKTAGDDEPSSGPQVLAPPSSVPPTSGSPPSAPEPSPPPLPPPPALPDLPLPTQAEATALPAIKPVEFDLEILGQPERLQSANPIAAYEGAEEFPANDHLMPIPPLFDPDWQSILLSELVATSLPSLRLDVRRMVDLLARGRWPARLPFLATRLASFGCEFLVDTGTGMEPFALDRLLLLKVAREIVGQDRLVVRFFRDCPTFGVEDPETLDMAEWKRPTRRCPIIVITDLGLNAPPDDCPDSTLDDWIAFADRVLRHQCPLTFIVPCPRDRIPRQLRRLAAVITWDRSTTIADVRRFRTRSAPGMHR